MEQYYSSLPLISTYKAKVIAEFLAYITSILQSPDLNHSRIGDISYSFQTEYPIIPKKVKQKAEPSIDLIEKRYRAEKHLMSTVENGNREKLEKLLNEEFLFHGKIPDRIPSDPLRSRKNITFVTNTLFRIAAEKGGLHPIYIDSISEKFAIQIEKTTSIQQLEDLQNKIPFEYCDAVQKLSLKKFNRLIQKAIEFIRLNLDHELSLEIISNAIHSSTYELSRQFRKETGQSITEYINRQRINESKLIMENDNLSVTDCSNGGF